MKAFTQEQILFLFDTCNKRGIDTSFINELPQKAERKTAVKNYNLIYPYQSHEFIDKWEKLRNTPKWKRKTQDCLQECLDWLGNYPEQVAIQSMSDSIRGGWQGLFEPKQAFIKRAENKVENLLSVNQQVKELYG